MAIRQHTPPAVSAVRGRNKGGSNKALGAPPRDALPAGQPKGTGRVGQRTQAQRAEELAHLRTVLNQLAEVGPATEGDNHAVVSAAREILAHAAERVARLYLAAIEQLFVTGQLASAAIHARAALELMEARDPAGNVERVITRTPRTPAPPATPPNINVGFVLGGARGTGVPHVHQVPVETIDATPSPEVTQ